MSKSILIVYYPKTQYHLVDALIERMRRKDIVIDGFNFLRLSFHSGKKLPRNIRFLRWLPQNRLVLFVLRTFFFTYIIRSITQEYDIIDIHSFEKWYIPFLQKCKKPYKLTIWGSDFYKEKREWQEKKRVLYKNASIIQVETRTVKEDLMRYEPSLNNRIHVCNFGVDILNEIDKLRNSNNHPLIDADGKIVITCGYGGTKYQQHLKILSAISRLDNDVKKKIHLCLPVTYGLSSSYRREILNELEVLDIPFSVFEKRLSDEDMAKLRLETDIVVNIQTTDSLSASLIQHLYASNILLVGDWLSYDIYDDNSLVYFPIKVEGLTRMIEEVVSNLSLYRNKVQDNYLKIRKFATWDAVEDKQADLYFKMLR